MSNLLTALAIVLIALLAIADASHAGPLRWIGEIESQPRSDGRRYAAYEPSAGTLRILDDVRGAMRDMEVDPSCRLVDIRYPRVLLRCSGATKDESGPRILDFVTGEVLRLPAAADDDNPNATFGFVRNRDSYSRLGEHWLSGSYDASPEIAHPVYPPIYLDWRKGERRHGRGGVRWDVNTPELAVVRRASCRGARGHYLWENRPPYAVFRREGKLRLGWCGRRRSILLSTCSIDACRGEQVGAGVVTWHEGPFVTAYLTKRDENFVWEIPGVTRGSASLGVMHTSSRVLAAASRPHADGRSHWELFEATLR